MNFKNFSVKGTDVLFFFAGQEKRISIFFSGKTKAAKLKCVLLGCFRNSISDQDRNQQFKVPLVVTRSQPTGSCVVTEPTDRLSPPYKNEYEHHKFWIGSPSTEIS